VDATAEGGAIRVVNTLEKRLERAWREMLPLLIKDVYQEVSDGTPAGS
jgi:V/A-type H+-transporting ATPase subunit E